MDNIFGGVHFLGTVTIYIVALPSNSCVTTAVAREQLCGHVSLAMREHAIMEEVFSERPMPGLYNKD
jgi:hypothetical protein